MPELMKRVYRIFRERITEDPKFDEDDADYVMWQLNTAIYRAQAEITREVTETDA